MENVQKIASEFQSLRDDVEDPEKEGIGCGSGKIETTVCHQGRRWRRDGRGRVGTSGTAPRARVAFMTNYCLLMISPFT